MATVVLHELKNKLTSPGYTKDKREKNLNIKRGSTLISLFRIKHLQSLLSAVPILPTANLQLKVLCADACRTLLHEDHIWLPQATM